MQNLAPAITGVSGSDFCPAKRQVTAKNTISSVETDRKVELNMFF
jgi:hypothetical protein